MLVFINADECAVDPDRLRSELKQLIVEECEIDFPPDDIDDDEYLLGEVGRLGLDSLDACKHAGGLHTGLTIA